MKFKSQICTSIKQIQRLLELGLKPETADMSWVCVTKEGLTQWVMTLNTPQNESNIDIPAWSLHRLKCLLPTKIPYKSGYLTTEIINNVNLMFITDTSEQRLISFIHENLYESMIKGIKWLIKEDYFNKEYLKQ